MLSCVSPTFRRFYGEKNLKEAFTYHLISRAYTYRGDFRSALDYEKRRYAIYKDRLGAENDYTRDSDECLRQLTQQAVMRARKVAEMSAPGTNNPNLKADAKSALQFNETDGSVNVLANNSLRSLLPNPLVSYGIGLPVPTVSSILETLNRVNGILVIHLRNHPSTEPDVTSPIAISSATDNTSTLPTKAEEHVSESCTSSASPHDEIPSAPVPVV